MGKQYRHGDVFITEVAEIPDEAAFVALTGDAILAEGEVTGHAHRIKDYAKISMWNMGTQRYIEVKEPVALTHEEHATIVLEPGLYESRIQRVYSPEAIRNVAD